MKTWKISWTEAYFPLSTDAIYKQKEKNNMIARNLTLMTDLYQLTMMQGYYERGEDDTVVFDMFFRSNPSGNGDTHIT